MAQRTSRHSEIVALVSFLFATNHLLPQPQGKKYIPVPLRSRHLASDGAERLVDTLAILITVLQHRDGERFILIAFDQLRARNRHARIALPRSTGDANSRLIAHTLLRGAKAQVRHSPAAPLDNYFRAAIPA